MRKILLSVLFFLLLPSLCLSAGKGKKTSDNSAFDKLNAKLSGWWSYNFILDAKGEKWGPPENCVASDLSPLDVASKRESRGYDVAIRERLADREKVLVVDILFVCSSRTTCVTRFVRGVDLCNKIQADDAAGKLDRAERERYQ